MHVLIPFILCLLVGTGAGLLGGTQWALIALIGVLITTIVNVAIHYRMNTHLDKPKTLPSIFLYSLSMFFLNSLITFMFAFATLLLYNAMTK